MRRLLPVGLAAAALLAAAAPHPDAARPVSAGSPQPRALLGISFHSPGGALAWFDPLTLEALPGRKAPLAKHTDAWALSADRRVVVLARWELPELRFVNARSMRVLGDLPLVRGAGGVRAIAWVRSDRLLAVVDDEPSPWLVVVNPETRRVVHRVPLPGPVFDAARTPDSLVLLLGSREAFVPTRVAVAGADGDVRTATAQRIRIGTVVDEGSNGASARTTRPGFAVDPDGRRAFLIGPDAVVAELDLTTLALGYHELSRPSALTRLARWLVPAAAAKAIDGPTRHARWLGHGLIAVGGADYSTVRDPAGTTHVIARAAGAQVLDTASWNTRTLNEDATEVDVANGLVLASGGSSDSANAQDVSGGIGIVAYGLDGGERWRLYPGRRRWLSPAAAYGYVYLEQDRVDVVDVASGMVLRTLTLRGEQWPSLLADQASIP